MKLPNPIESDLHYCKRDFVPRFESGQISLRYLAAQCQDIAGEHAEKLGLGEQFKIDNQFLYVVMRYKGYFLSPLTEKKYTLVTYPTFPGPLQMYRYFYLLDENEEVVFYFISLWIMMDSITRRIKLAKPFKTQILSVLPDLESIAPISDETLSNFDYSEKELVWVNEYQVKKEDIDSNGHMNNTIYFKIAQNVLPTFSFTTFEIDFEKECFENEKIELWMAKEESSIIVVGKKEDSTLSFKIKFN